MQIIGTGVPLYQEATDILVATFISTTGSKREREKKSINSHDWTEENIWYYQ